VPGRSGDITVLGVRLADAVAFLAAGLGEMIG
jgi:hypothetical protein